MSDKYLENVKELGENDKFCTILKKSLDIFMPSKRRVIVIILILLIMSFPIGIAISSNNTLDILLKIFEVSNDIIKDLFAINFTGYALFQALVSSRMLKEMLSTDSSNKNNMFKEFNLYFFGLSVLYISIIIFNYLSIIGINMITGYELLINYNIKTFILYLSFYSYIFINLFAIIEIKSFIVNMYNCFKINALTESVKELEGSKIE